MKNETTLTAEEQIEIKLIDLFEKNNLDIDISYFYMQQYRGEINEFYDLYDILLSNNALDVEIIYYHKAIDFLKDNDPSLCDSIALACELGCNLENLNSEFLASILATDILRTQFFELEPEINEIFELKN